MRWTRRTGVRSDEILDGTLRPELRAQLQDLRYHGVKELARELDEHIAANKFLIVVDADSVARIYFPVVDESHPDYERIAPAGA
jgi:hypothetical protein